MYHKLIKFALQTYILFKHIAICNHLYTDNYKTNKAIHYFPHIRKSVNFLKINTLYLIIALYY